MECKSLLLIWRDLKTQMYFHVATLTYDEGKYIFEYTYKSEGTRKVQDAIEHGYPLLPVFKDLKKTYTSDKLFSTFHRRIPTESRIDYINILKELMLPEDAHAMDILRKTRGILAGDPHFFMEPLRLNENTGFLSTDFYISGMRYRNLPKEWYKIISMNEQLIAVHEPHSKDVNAIQLWTENDLFLGYVPAIYSKAIRSLLDRSIQLKLTLKEMRPNLDPVWWAY